MDDADDKYTREALRPWMRWLHRTRPPWLLAGVQVLGHIATPGAENWPQWRGPYLNGLSSETDLPVRWTTTENVAWRLPLPEWSGSTPIVWRDRVFLNVAAGPPLELWAIDRNHGRPVWKRHLSDGNHKEQKQNMSSPSPVTDGDRVFVMTGTGILKAFDFDGMPFASRPTPTRRRLYCAWIAVARL